MHEKEIERDIPLLYAKIAQCDRSILDYERNIIVEETNIGLLSSSIKEDKERAASGQRQRYDSVDMKMNIERHRKNIVMFTGQIQKEKEQIAKFGDIIRVLQDDAKRPDVLVFDMRKAKQRG